MRDTKQTIENCLRNNLCQSYSIQNNALMEVEKNASIPDRFLTFTGEYYGK
jgi:hypothetical protein